MNGRRPTLLRPGLVAFLQARLQDIGRVLCGSPGRGDATVSRSRRSADAALAEAVPLRKALKRLLDQHPASRCLMRHLGYVERALGRQGTLALDEVPVEVVVTALTQLDTIVSD